MLLKSVAALCLALSLWGAVHAYSAFKGDNEPAVIATVNGIPVEEAEFRRVLRLQRASVIAYFRTRYDARVGDGFWQTSFGGEVPAAYAKEQALRELTKLKVQLSLAESKGLIRGTSLAYLTEQMVRENERRAKADAAGEAVYGPIRLDENQFYDYLISHLAEDLKEKLAQRELAATESELQAFYESIKDPLFKREDTVRFEKFAVHYGKGGGDEEAGESKSRALQAMATIKNLLEQGEAAGKIAQELRQSDERLQAEASEERLSDDNARTYSKLQPALYDALRREPRDRPVGDVIDEAMNGDYVLFKVLERKPGGYRSYAETADAVAKQYLNAAYDDYIGRLAEEAEVVVDERNYNRLTVE